MRARSTTTRFRTTTSARTKSSKKDLRAQFDVILWPHGGGDRSGAADDAARRCRSRRRAEFQALGYPDETEDTRGGLGQSGLKRLYDFVAAGGTLDHRRRHVVDLPDELPDAGHHGRSGEWASSRRDRSTAASSPTRRARSSTAFRAITCRCTTRTHGGPLFSVGGQPGPLAAAPALPAGRGGGGRGGASIRTRSRWARARTCSARGIRRKDWTPPRAAPGAGSRSGALADAVPAFGGRGGGGWLRWRSRRRRIAGRGDARLPPAARDPALLVRRARHAALGRQPRRREPRESSAGDRRARSAKATS